MAIKQQKYDEYKILMLKEYLEDQIKAQMPVQYEIYVGNLRVVSRTYDVALFDLYEKYLNEDTDLIRINIYSSDKSPRNNQHIFFLKESRVTQDLGDIDSILNERLAAKDREYEIGKLRDDLASAKAELKEAEDYSDLLEKQIEQLKSGQSHKQMSLLEMGSVMLEGLIRRNPQWLNGVPLVGNALAGIISQEGSQPTGAGDLSNTESQVNFSPKNEMNGSPGRGLSSSIAAYLDTSFDSGQLSKVLIIIEKMADEPATIDDLIKYLNL